MSQGLKPGVPRRQSELCPHCKVHDRLLQARNGREFLLKGGAARLDPVRCTVAWDCPCGAQHTVTFVELAKATGGVRPAISTQPPRIVPGVPIKGDPSP